MGDVIHTLPALTDAAKIYPDIQVDWVVEKSFQEIPTWHPTVRNVIPVELRRFRKHFFCIKSQRAFFQSLQRLKQESYDYVIDAQGLFKSVMLMLFTKGKRVGLSWFSAREHLASLFYQQRIEVPWTEHAVYRLRRLLALALDYPIPTDMPNYGIDRKRLFNQSENLKVAQSYFVFLHGTTWATKHWPDPYWVELGKMAELSHHSIYLLWGNESERQRALYISEHVPAAVVCPKMDLKAVAELLAGAKGVVSVDTGLGHLAAALNIPTLSLYGASDPQLTGMVGENQMHLKSDFACSPCFSKHCTYKGKKSTQIQPPCMGLLSPQQVWEHLSSLIAGIKP